MTAAERARWLAELVQALEEAQAAIWRLGISGNRNADTLDLLARVESARAEARALRFGRLIDAAKDADREWTNPVPWDGPQPERCT